MVSNPQEVDKGRRNLLVRAATLAGTGAVIGAFSSVEPAYAAVKKITDFKDRRGNINSANSTFHDPQTTTFDTSQGEPVTVQVTPTPDLQATKTALDIKSVELDIQKKQIDNRFAFLTYIGTPATVLITGGLGIATYLYSRGKDREARRIEREKRDEDRFQEAVLALGKDETKLAAVTTLRTFLQEEGKGYERFYKQIFDLTVGFLQNRVVDPKNPKPVAFNRAIIKLFLESYPLARKLAKEKFEKEKREYDSSYLDASNVNLDGFDRMGLGFDLDLSEAWICNASFKDTSLSGVNLSGANLSGADFSRASLSIANLSGANLYWANLIEAGLSGANLMSANLMSANLHRASFSMLILSGGASLNEADLSGRASHISANLSGANLSRADLSDADLAGANPEDAAFLLYTRMWDVKNYPDPQKRQKCKDKGATFIFEMPFAAPDTKGETK